MIYTFYDVTEYLVIGENEIEIWEENCPKTFRNFISDLRENFYKDQFQ